MEGHSGLVARRHHLHRRILTRTVVKLTFAKGASLQDPAGLFNSSLDGNARRAIDIHEGEEVDESAFKALVRQAARAQQFWQVESFEESEVLSIHFGLIFSIYKAFGQSRSYRCRGDGR